MAKKYFIFSFLIAGNILYAQVPGKAFNPMTANGAKRISTYSHILFWENPSGVIYNEIFVSDDSILVAGLDPSVKLLSGFPSSVYDSLSLSLMDTIINGTWYYWRVVEYNQNGSSVGDIWKFRTRGYNPWYFEDFSNGLVNWEIVGPFGINNWTISYSHNLFNDALTLNNFINFNGYSLIKLKRIFSIYYSGFLKFATYYHWRVTGSSIGAAYTTDEGFTWNILWEEQPSGNIFSNYMSFLLPDEEVQIGFYFSGDTFDFYSWEIAEIRINHALYLLTPPSLLTVKADSLSQKIHLNWNPGQFNPPDPITSYKIERKEGMPNSSNEFYLIAEVDPDSLHYADINITLNNIYTYRIRTVALQHESSFSNDATAYVPAVVPVELINFTVIVENENVRLGWSTGSEINNSGFDIERKNPSLNPPEMNSGQALQGGENNVWEKIGFIDGNGTTTETKFYSFTDDNISEGLYKYRLKQVDYNGSFTYSEEVEIEVNILPKQFVLYQNYPNPFNPSATIKYSIPVSDIVRLKVYDILGREVASLVNEYQTAGTYTVKFNGSRFASGVYFYQLQSGNYVEIQKMILMK